MVRYRIVFNLNALRFGLIKGGVNVMVNSMVIVMVVHMANDIYSDDNI
jgi:hypothetical protein